MGEHAVIAYIPDDQEIPSSYEKVAQAGTVGIYLHEDGEPEHIKAFLTAAKHYNFRTSEYGLARLIQLIGNYLNPTYGISLGISPVEKLNADNYNNGTYVVHNWEIVGQWFEMGQLDYNEKLFSNTYNKVRAVNDPIFTPPKVERS